MLVDQRLLQHCDLTSAQVDAAAAFCWRGGGGQNGRGNAHDSPQHGIRSSLITHHNKLEFQGGAFDFTQGCFPRDGVRQTPAARGKAFTVEGFVRGREHSASPPGGVCGPAQSVCVQPFDILCLFCIIYSTDLTVEKVNGE